MNDGNSSWAKGYYKKPTGEIVVVNMHGIDLHDAVRRFPEQYSLTDNFGSTAPKAEEKKPTHHRN
jgi:hypothetical protein